MCSTYQCRNDSNSDYVKSIGSRAEVIKAMGMKVGYFHKIVKNRLVQRLVEAGISTKTTDEDEKKMIEEMRKQEMKMEAVQEQYLVYLAFQLLDKSRFGGMQKSMKSASLTSVTKWPKTNADLIGLLDVWELLNLRSQQQPPPQQQQPVQDKDGANVDKDKDEASSNSKVEDAEKGGSEGPSFMQQKVGENANSNRVRTNSQGESECMSHLWLP